MLSCRAPTGRGGWRQHAAAAQHSHAKVPPPVHKRCLAGVKSPLQLVPYPGSSSSSPFLSATRGSRRCVLRVTARQGDGPDPQRQAQNGQQQQQQQQQQQNNGLNSRRSVWTVIGGAAMLGSVGGALAALLGWAGASYALALPLVLPVVSLVAALQREGLIAEDNKRQYDRLSSSMHAESQALLDEAKVSIEDVRRELHSRGGSNAGKLKDVEARLASLEGSILSAGRSAREAAAGVAAMPQLLARDLCSQHDAVLSAVRGELRRAVDARGAEEAAALARLDVRMAGVEGSLSGLEVAQSEGLRRLSMSLTSALTDAEATLQASIRNEVVKSLDPVRRLPQMLSAALPQVVMDAELALRLPANAVAGNRRASDATPSLSAEELRDMIGAELAVAVNQVLDSQADALAQLSLVRPVPMEEAQWEALGKRLSRLERLVEDVPAAGQQLLTGAIDAAASRAAEALRADSRAVDAELRDRVEALRSMVEPLTAMLEAVKERQGAVQPGFDDGGVPGDAAAASDELKGRVEEVLAVVRGASQKLDAILHAALEAQRMAAVRAVPGTDGNGGDDADDDQSAVSTSVAAALAQQQTLAAAIQRDVNEKAAAAAAEVQRQRDAEREEQQAQQAKVAALAAEMQASLIALQATVAQLSAQVQDLGSKVSEELQAARAQRAVELEQAVWNSRAFRGPAVPSPGHPAAPAEGSRDSSGGTAAASSNRIGPVTVAVASTGDRSSEAQPHGRKDAHTAGETSFDEGVRGQGRHASSSQPSEGGTSTLELELEREVLRPSSSPVTGELWDILPPPQDPGTMQQVPTTRFAPKDDYPTAQSDAAEAGEGIYDQDGSAAVYWQQQEQPPPPNEYDDRSTSTGVTGSRTSTSVHDDGSTASASALPPLDVATSSSGQPQASVRQLIFQEQPQEQQQQQRWQPAYGRDALGMATSPAPGDRWEGEAASLPTPSFAERQASRTPGPAATAYPAQPAGPSAKQPLMQQTYRSSVQADTQAEAKQLEGSARPEPMQPWQPSTPGQQQQQQQPGQPVQQEGWRPQQPPPPEWRKQPQQQPGSSAAAASLAYAHDASGVPQTRGGAPPPDALPVVGMPPATPVSDGAALYMADDGVDELGPLDESMSEEACLAEGLRLLRLGREEGRRTDAGADLGRADRRIQRATELFERAANMASTAVAAAEGEPQAMPRLQQSQSRALGNWGNALLARGELRLAYLVALRDGPMPSTPAEASAHRQTELALAKEANELLTSAGERFKAVLQLGGWSSRALVNWGRAMCLRAELAVSEGLQNTNAYAGSRSTSDDTAARLYQAAIDKFEAVLETDPEMMPARYRCALAKLGLAQLRLSKSGPAGGNASAMTAVAADSARAAMELLVEAEALLRDVLAADKAAAADLQPGAAEALEQVLAVRPAVVALLSGPPARGAYAYGGGR